MRNCKLCKTYAKTLPGRLCADCYWEEDRKYKYNLYLEAGKRNGQGVRNNRQNEHPPPQGEDGGLGVLRAERTDTSLSPERNVGLPVEKTSH